MALLLDIFGYLTVVLRGITHVPLALAGITAGWARWIELRLPGTPARIASWIWPAAFVVVGFILLIYREA